MGAKPEGLRRFSALLRMRWRCGAQGDGGQQGRPLPDGWQRAPRPGVKGTCPGGDVGDRGSEERHPWENGRLLESLVLLARGNQPLAPAHRGWEQV